MFFEETSAFLNLNLYKVSDRKLINKSTEKICHIFGDMAY